MYHVRAQGVNERMIKLMYIIIMSMNSASIYRSQGNALVDC